MSNSHKPSGVVLIIAITMLMPILVVGCGKTERGSQASSSKPSMPDEQYYGYLKTKFDGASNPSEKLQLMKSYLSAYPKGKHMGEATGLLEEAQKQSSRKCESNLKQLGWACGIYADSYQGRLPVEFSLLTNLISSTQLAKILVCPSANDQTKPSYRLAGYQGRWQDNPDAVIVEEIEDNHSGFGNFLYNEGQVAFQNRVEVQAVQKKMQSQKK